MAQVVTQSGGVAEDAATARRLYRAMYLVRRFEERTEEQYTRARIGGYCHLCIGEEASHVGAIDAARRGRLPVRELPRPRLGARRRLGSDGGHGRALRQGDRRRGRLRRLDAPARRRAPLLRRLGHRRRAPADRGRRGARARPDRDAAASSCASSATARPTSAPSTRRSTWPRSGTCRSSSRSSTTCTAWAPRSRRRRPSRSCTGAPRAYRMHGERVDGNDLAAVREAAGRLLRSWHATSAGRRCSSA